MNHELVPPITAPITVASSTGLFSAMFGDEANKGKSDPREHGSESAATSTLLNGQEVKTDLPAFSLKGNNGTITKVSSNGDPVQPELNKSIKLDWSTVISLQSLLCQFSHPKVRADFINGRFGPSIRPTLLSKIDDLRCTIFPRWQSGGLKGAAERSAAAVLHLSKLLSLSTDLLILDDLAVKDSYTYKEWYFLLDAISSDRYWVCVASEDRCTHILRSMASSVRSVTANVAAVYCLHLARARQW